MSLKEPYIGSYTILNRKSEILINFLFSKGKDTINSSEPIEVKVIPVVEVSPLFVSAIEGAVYAVLLSLLLICVLLYFNQGPSFDA